MSIIIIINIFSYLLICFNQTNQIITKRTKIWNFQETNSENLHRSFTIRKMGDMIWTTISRYELAVCYLYKVQQKMYRKHNTQKSYKKCFSSTKKEIKDLIIMIYARFRQKMTGEVFLLRNANFPKLRCTRCLTSGFANHNDSRFGVCHSCYTIYTYFSFIC